MPNLRLKFNEESDAIEVWVGDQVIDKVEPEILESWVSAYNAKHGYVKEEPKPEEPESTEEVKENEQEPNKED